MLNKDKYATAKEAMQAFYKYCKPTKCHNCPLFDLKTSCYLLWMYADENDFKPAPQWQNDLMEKFTNKE